MIDTKELRAFCDEECHPNGSLLRNTVDELDRLYELERLNTPYHSSEKLEDALKKAGFERYAPRTWNNKMQDTCDIVEDIVFVTKQHTMRFVLPISAVTPALLKKLLEGK